MESNNNSSNNNTPTSVNPLTPTLAKAPPMATAETHQTPAVSVEDKNMDAQARAAARRRARRPQRDLAYTRLGALPSDLWGLNSPAHVSARHDRTTLPTQPADTVAEPNKEEPAVTFDDATTKAVPTAVVGTQQQEDEEAAATKKDPATAMVEGKAVDEIVAPVVADDPQLVMNRIMAFPTDDWSLSAKDRGAEAALGRTKGKHGDTTNGKCIIL